MPSAARKPLPRAFVAVSALLGAFTVFYFTISFAALAVRQSEDVVTTYRGVTELRVDGGDGDVTIVADDRDDVQVVAHRRWGMSEPDQRLSLVRGTLRIDDDSCGFIGSIGFDGCSTSYEIRVPADMPVTASVSSGDLRALGLDGPVRLHASSGDLEAEDVTGDLTAVVSAGEIEISGYRGRALTATASSGDVTVRADVAPERVKAETSSGDVTVEVPGSEAYSVLVDTGSGDTDVEVEQSATAAHAIEARSGSGDVCVLRLGSER